MGKQWAKINELADGLIALQNLNNKVSIIKSKSSNLGSIIPKNIEKLVQRFINNTSYHDNVYYDAYLTIKI